MDPEATLTRLRELVGEINAAFDADDDCTDMAVEMAELFGALDSWLCKEGFLPKTWAQTAKEPEHGKA
jgi:hypothetical protein